MNYDLKKIALMEKIGNAFALLSGAFLCVSTVFMFANMLTRTTADFNIRFVYDLCSLCAAGVASFAIPYTTLKGGHTTMDTLLAHLKPRAQAACEAISGVITMVVMAFTVGVLTSYAYQRTLVLEATTTAKMPTYIFRWLYALGMFLTMLAAAIEMIDMFRLAAGKPVIRNREQLEEMQKLEAQKDGGENV